MWPFRRNTDTSNDDVETFSNLGESKFFEDIKSGEETHYGGRGSGIAISEIDRARDMHNVLRKGDYRASIMDPEVINCLLQRYGKEITTAEDAMQKKLSSQKPYERYDYDGDRRYQQWKQDKEQVLERLQVHWIDMLIDRPLTMLVYYLRIGVVSGVFYGVGRTAYLYRTMDKMYAKLNGVTVGKIAFHEFTYAIAKGGMIAVAGSTGIIMGNVLSSLMSVAASGDVHVPERQWWHVWCCGTVSGFFAGAAFAGLHFRLFTPKAMGALAAAFTGCGSLVGWHYGYRVYRPFAATRTHGLYDAYWRPWNQRFLKAEGPGNIRGRYV